MLSMILRSDTSPACPGAQATLPLSLTFVLFLVMGMVSLRGVNIAMYTALRRLTLVFVMGLDYIMLVCGGISCGQTYRTGISLQINRLRIDHFRKIAYVTSSVLAYLEPLLIFTACFSFVQRKASTIPVRRAVAIMVVCGSQIPPPLIFSPNALFIRSRGWRDAVQVALACPF
jgi:hypothetical protein